MAMTRSACASRRLVREPRPGPISMTSGSRSGHAARAMRSRTEPRTGSVGRVSGAPRLALAADHVVNAAEGNQHLAVGRLAEPGGRREAAEEHHLGEVRLHFRADLALLHGIVGGLTFGVDIQLATTVSSLLMPSGAASTRVAAVYKRVGTSFRTAGRKPRVGTSRLNINRAETKPPAKGTARGRIRLSTPA